MGKSHGLRGLIFSMDTAMICTLTVALGLALSTTGLGVDVRQFAHRKSRFGWYFHVTLPSDANTDTPYRPIGRMYYGAKGMEWGTLQALIGGAAATAAFGVLLEMLCVLRMWKRPFKQTRVEGTDDSEDSELKWLSPAILALAFIPLVISVATTAYAAPLFVPSSTSTYGMIRNEYLKPPLPAVSFQDAWNRTDFSISTVTDQRTYNPVSWNCAVSQVAIWGYWQVLDQCRKGIVAYDLMIPLCVLQGAIVAMAAWVLRREKRDARAAAWAALQHN